MCEITTIFFHFCFVYIIIYGIVMNKPRIWLPLRNLVIYFFYFNYIKQLLRSTNLYISAKYFIYYGLYVQIFLFNHAIVLRNSLTTHFSSTEARDYMYSIWILIAQSCNCKICLSYWMHFALLVRE